MKALIDDMLEGTRAYEENEAAKAEITRLNKAIYAIAERGEDDTAEAEGEVAGAVSAVEAELADDKELARLYWRGRELSYEYFKEFYARIGVKFDKFYPESTVAGRGLEEVQNCGQPHVVGLLHGRNGDAACRSLGHDDS